MRQSHFDDMTVQSYFESLCRRVRESQHKADNTGSVPGLNESPETAILKAYTEKQGAF